MNVYSTYSNYGTYDLTGKEYQNEGRVPMNVHKQFEFIVDRQLFDISKIEIIPIMLNECKVSWDFYSMGDGYLKCLLWVNCDGDKKMSYYIEDVVHAILDRSYI